MPSAPLTTSAKRTDDLRYLTDRQQGVVARAQLLAIGFSANEIAAQLAAKRWQMAHDGVYFTFTGVAKDAGKRWAGLLACGDGAVLSHETAAEIHGFAEASRDAGVVHVMIADSRKEVSPRGVRVHRSRLIAQERDIRDGYPVTSAPDTVLDLAARTRSPDVVVALITSACRSGATSVEDILKRMGRRKRQRHRDLIKAICHDVSGGVRSVLERAYLNRVERPHGLPRGRRQAPARAGESHVVRDIDYDEYATVVELDGRKGHEGVGQHRDAARDNFASEEGKTTLRYGHAPIFGSPCDVARQVANVLQRHGWTGSLSPCGPKCASLR